MELYLNPAKITEITGVDEPLINRTLEQRDADIAPYLRVVSAASGDKGTRVKPQIELRIDGLAPFIKKLTDNTPADIIIENLSIQVVYVTQFRETSEKLEAEKLELLFENEKLHEKIEQLHREKQEFEAEINELERHLEVSELKMRLEVSELRAQLAENQKQEQPKSWIDRLLNRKE